MFESDDFDQILSQFDIPNGIIETNNQKLSSNVKENLIKLSHFENSCPNTSRNQKKCENDENLIQYSNVLDKECSKLAYNSHNAVEKAYINNAKNKDKVEIKSPKHTKRKIINSHFDCSKRKFPGPAGLLSGQINDNNDNVQHVELHSQDVDFTQDYLQKKLFESPIWNRLLLDVKEWQLIDIDSIKNIKQQALAGNLKRRKAQIVTAFVETVDRSVTDPLIILQDITGKIKGTLHRDAWSKFSPYIVSEYCALILWQPTVLTTGSGYKKHYLNITLNNIFALYSSAVINDNEDTDKESLEGYVKFQDEFTIFKALNLNYITSDSVKETNLLDGLDDSLFNEDIFL